MNAWYHGALTLAARAPISLRSDEFEATRALVCRSGFAGWGLGVLFAASALSCAAPHPSEHPGSSDARFGAPARSAEAAPPAPQPYPGWAEMRNWEALLAEDSDVERRPSLGHGGGRYAFSTHVDPAHVRAYRELVVERPLASDATIYVRLFDAKSGDPGPIYLMHKTANAWQYAELNPAGEIQPTPLEACRRCHAEAPTDQLFGLPRAK